MTLPLAMTDSGRTFDPAAVGPAGDLFYVARLNLTTTDLTRGERDTHNGHR